MAQEQLTDLATRLAAVEQNQLATSTKLAYVEQNQLATDNQLAHIEERLTTAEEQLRAATEKLAALDEKVEEEEQKIEESEKWREEVNWYIEGVIQEIDGNYVIGEVKNNSSDRLKAATDKEESEGKQEETAIKETAQQVETKEEERPDNLRRSYKKEK